MNHIQRMIRHTGTYDLLRDSCEDISKGRNCNMALKELVRRNVGQPVRKVVEHRTAKGTSRIVVRFPKL